MLLMAANNSSRLHARFPGQTGRDDGNIRFYGIRVVAAPENRNIGTDHRHRLLKIVRLSLWQPLKDVKQHAIRMFSICEPMVNLHRRDQHP